MPQINRFLKEFRWNLFLILVLIIASRFCIPAHAATFDAAAEAGTFTFHDGTLEKTKGGITYRRADGRLLTNAWANIAGKVYYFDAKGHAVTGSFSQKGQWYYAAKNGVIQVNAWRKEKTGTYYYGKTGAQIRGALHNIAGKTYYFSSNGKLKKNAWQKVGSAWYYLTSNGSTARSRRVGSYYVDADGKRAVRKLVTISGKMYYFGANGKMVKNKTITIGATRYTFGSNGALKSKKQMAPSSSVNQKGMLIFMGASRVREMGIHITSAGLELPKDKTGTYWKTAFIAQNGKGYSWCVNTAIPRMKTYLKEYPCSKVILQFGNNDLNSRNDGNIQKYIVLYRKLIRQYPKASFYVMDVLPSAGNSPMNPKRRVFNRQLAKAFPKQYIGGYNYMVTTGFSTSYNTAHYTPATSRKIYSYVLKKIGIQ